MVGFFLAHLKKKVMVIVHPKTRDEGTDRE
jgi:hypothetical protein